MAVQPIPKGYHRVNIHLTFKDTKKAIEFYQKAFGAEAGQVMPGPGGAVMHAEITMGDTVVFMADDMMGKGSTVEGGNASAFVPHIWVTDCDAAFKRAVDAGCKATMPLADQFWGDRYGQVEDPFGLTWAIATHKEDLTPDEMMKRQAKQFGG